MKKFLRILFSFFFLFVLISSSNAQPILNWNKIYDYNHFQDYAYQVIVDDSENVFIVGQTEISNNPSTNFDAVILKYDPYGNLLWSRRHHLASWGGNDIFLKAVPGKSGNIFLSGNMQVNNNSKMFNIMYSSDGDTIWADEQNYDTYWPYDFRNIYEQDSIYYVTDAYFFGNLLKLVILKYDKTGSLLSASDSQEFDGVPESITFADSSLLLTYSKRDNNYMYRSYAQKMNLSGVLEWETLITDTMFSVRTKKTLSDKNDNTYSISLREETDTSIYYLTKLDHRGELLWDTSFIVKNNFHENVIDLVISDSGIIKIVGTASIWNGSYLEWNTFVALYDTSGEFIDIHEQTIPYTVQSFVAPKYDQSGNIYMSFAIQNTLGYTDILVIKLNEVGDLEYEKIYSHNSNQTYSEEPSDMFIINEDDYVITARECGPVEAFNILTLRYGSELTAVGSANNYPVTSYNLYQNYPNPFNPNTKINYILPSTSFTSLKVYNFIGELVRVLVEAVQDDGEHSVIFNAEGLSSGIYFYRLQAGDFVQTKKMVLIK